MNTSFYKLIESTSFDGLFCYFFEVIYVKLIITEKLGSDSKKIKLWRCFNYRQDNKDKINSVVVLLQEPVFVDKPGIEAALVKIYNFFLTYDTTINQIYFFNACPMAEKEITLKKYKNNIIEENFNELRRILLKKTTTAFYYGGRKLSKMQNETLRDKVNTAMYKALENTNVKEFQLVDKDGKLAYPAYGKAVSKVEKLKKDIILSG